MKISINKIALLIIFSLSFSVLFAQQGLPQVKLKDLKGGTILTSDFDNEGKPMIISFWATWCKPCIKELTTISEVYPDWVDETGVKLIAISTDDARMAPLVPSFVNGRDWEYDVYIDENGDFKRAMNVVNIPHTFLVDKDGNVVYQHVSYAPGDEEELYEKVLELIEGEE
jgi:cytochrome c biogenesis protein CcmG/thiol:disulfide interchange protein DsbE